MFRRTGGMLLISSRTVRMVALSRREGLGRHVFAALRVGGVSCWLVYWP